MPADAAARWLAWHSLPLNGSVLLRGLAYSCYSIVQLLSSLLHQDIEKEMEVMDKVLPESVAEQQAQFEQPHGPAGGAAGEQQKQQRQ
ncbi:hypothetical protein OEZ86_010801 [Tetradesmus obliquus]|nr:hypothetical protein OEZ86_010801 [Tetradesmus obliquus]